MKIKLDENLTVAIVPILKKLGHYVQTTIEGGLPGKLDQDIGQAAQREERFLMTQDTDFSDVRRFAPGTHQGILLLGLHSPNPAAIISRLADLFANEGTEAWQRCFGVATERKVPVLHG